MKQSIFILSSLLCICIVNNASASDYIEEETLASVAEKNTGIDNVQLSEEDYIRDTMDEIAKTRARVDELLIPVKTNQNLWTNDQESVQAVFLTPQAKQKIKNKPQNTLGNQTYYGETVYIINNFLYGGADNVSETSGVYSGGKMYAEYADCPFDTSVECAIWLRKPIISESVAPRSKMLRDDKMCEISTAIENNPNISANDKSMIPLLNRYKVLMRASQSCCTSGMKYKLEQAGASQGLVYKFLSDDANFSGFGMRCLVMDDNQIENTDKYQATSATVADVRNECLCKSKTTFKALLAPFAQLYDENPSFANAPFEYRHYDGVGRYVTDSVNMDVQNVLHQLEMCP